MPRRLLLIDAEPAVGTSVRRLLQEVHEVHSVQDVRLALQLLSRGERYDAILCDMVLPGMSGVDFLLRAGAARARAVPAHGLHDQRGVLPAGRASSWPRYSGELLEKPFEPDRLRRFVQRLLA